MDAARFDALARSLTTAGSRRRAFTIAASGALGVLGLAGPDDTNAKKKKPCPPCKKRKKGKCKRTLPDGVACAGGTCQGGSCVAVGCPAGAKPCDSDRVCEQGVCVLPCGKGGVCRVFLTSTRHDGSVGIGQLIGADAICQDLAVAAGLPGTYMAWLSDSTTSPATRFVRSPGPYRLINGTTIAANWTGLTDFPYLAAPINVTETGVLDVNAREAWTSTFPSGQRVEYEGDIANPNCLNWTSASSTRIGIAGQTWQSDNSFWSYGPPKACNNSLPLYCFQQS